MNVLRHLLLQGLNDDRYCVILLLGGRHWVLIKVVGPRLRLVASWTKMLAERHTIRQELVLIELLDSSAASWQVMVEATQVRLTLLQFLLLSCRTLVRIGPLTQVGNQLLLM